MRAECGYEFGEVVLVGTLTTHRELQPPYPLLHYVDTVASSTTGAEAIVASVQYQLVGCLMILKAFGQSKVLAPLLSCCT